jgi:hypothetical protein
VQGIMPLAMLHLQFRSAAQRAQPEYGCFCQVDSSANGTAHTRNTFLAFSGMQ